MPRVVFVASLSLTRAKATQNAQLKIIMVCPGVM